MKISILEYAKNYLFTRYNLVITPEIFCDILSTMYIKNFDPYDFSKVEIDGVPIYYKNLSWAPCIHIRIVFNTGAFDDPEGKEGLSHFFEHMVFDGCPTLPDKKAIQEWSKIHALNTSNAWTSFENTTYWLRCLPEEYQTALAGMKDMIFYSYFRPEDVEHERKVITQEAWNRFQNEKFLAYTKEYLDNIFHGHEHSRFYSPLGWPETIAEISQEDILSWHKSHYGIGNFFIVLAGNVEDKHIEMLKDFLKDLPKVTKEVRREGQIRKPKEKRFVKTADEIGEVKEQVEISLLRFAEKMPYEKNEIASIFSKLVYEILHERLRIEQSLCYNVNVGVWDEKTYSEMGMNVKTDEKNIEIVEKEFRNVLNEIKDNKHQNRFETIKKVYSQRVKSQELLSGDIADDTLSEISKFDGQTFTLENQLKEIEKVTYQDVVQFSDWAFDPDYTYTEIILPSKK